MDEESKEDRDMIHGEIDPGMWMNEVTRNAKKTNFENDTQAEVEFMEECLNKLDLIIQQGFLFREVFKSGDFKFKRRLEGYIELMDR